MTIAAVEAIPYRLPTRRPVRFANGEVAGAEHVLVRVRTTDGVEGIAEASPRPMTYGDNVAGVVHMIRNIAAPAWVGANELAPAELHHRLRHLQGNFTARAALDVALYDLLGQRSGLPVASLLGGYAKRVRVSHLLSMGSAEDMAQEVSDVAKTLGVRAFKVKVGEDAATDIARIAAVFEALGTNGLVYADANHGWRPDEALTVIRALETAGHVPAWVEEPTPASDTVGRRWLVNRVDVPIVADESAPDVAAASAQLRDGLSQWLSLKAARSGFRVSQRLLGVAQGLGAEVVVGSQIEGALGVAANLHLAAAFAETGVRPAELTSAEHFEDDVITPLAVQDGWMQVPTAPGLGVAVDETRLRRLRSA